MKPFVPLFASAFQRRSATVTVAVVLGALAAAASTSAAGPSDGHADYVVAEAPLELGGGANILVTQMGSALCVNDSIDHFICLPVFFPIDNASVGTTIWTDASIPETQSEYRIISFTEFVDKITNGNEDWLVREFQIGGGGGGVGGPESDLFGPGAGPSGVDLAGYAIHRIGLRVDALSLESPGTDPNGDGRWTDVALRGTFVFEGTVASPSACARDGWKRLRGPDGERFASLTECVRFAAMNS